MNYEKLFQMQRKLDATIIDKKELAGEDLFNRLVHALLTVALLMKERLVCPQKNQTNKF